VALDAGSVLVLNCGSSSVKVALVDPETGERSLTGLGERVGSADAVVHIRRSTEETNSAPRDVGHHGVVTHLLGAHIEQTSTPYLDYTVGSIYQPHEHSLELSHSHLLELDDALTKLNGKPARVAYADFTIWPNDPKLREQMQKVKQMTESKQRATQWNQPN